jgi:Domain of unknown function (DUF4347)
MRIVLVNANRDGVAQMVDALRGEQGVTGVHILSHGSQAHVQLGSSVLDEASMSTVYRSALTSIHGNLANGADILVYGCDFGKGADGARASELLASLTAAWEICERSSFHWVIQSSKAQSIISVLRATMRLKCLRKQTSDTEVGGVPCSAHSVITMPRRRLIVRIGQRGLSPS